jgi:hypothetical protein
MNSTRYEHLEGIRLATVVPNRWAGKFTEISTYRYLNQVPLNSDYEALLVNWCELTVTKPEGKIVYKNSFATHNIPDETMAAIVPASRTR